ncbi:tyrosine-type recombinase/integrase [Winogradskyella thalassocola]|uniref:Site-specific recombinase XerD n=1 Tax=Winogradskyella thalassocola TaxID=262004 RepID=A0A1G7ZN03_9FLAO|nr:site-specific integrase [Winogradskyella thalassocola]SDH09480.1 Site-specific recombinase XerD [Winogradskyella thalassocola]
MSSFFLLLQNVHDIVHVFPMKSNYSDPKLFTGGVDINSWSKLSKKEKMEALNKDWYIYYSFRNPKTGKLVRQTNIKGGVNRYKDKRTRYHLLKVLKQSLEIVLQEGFNPYKDNETLVEHLQNKIDGMTSKTKKSTLVTTVVESTPQKQIETTISEAFKLALELKEKAMAASSFIRYKSRINIFKKWLLENEFKEKDDIDCITKKTVIKYLNSILLNSSSRNRNNSRTDIASFFQILEDNDLIKENFVKKINVLRSSPTRNKTYKPIEIEEIFDYLKSNDPLLFLYVQLVSYNVLRPIEVCRLKIGDIDLEDKKLYVRAKNQPVKIKIIPSILLKELPNLSQFDKKDFLFTSSGIGGKWEATENSKRDFFTKRFKKVKDSLGLGVEYGLYSFRHTFITIMYREMAKTMSPYEVKSKLMLITGHATMTALEKYLRDIDAVLPEDYSKLLIKND